MESFRGGIKFFLFFFWTILLVPPQALIMLFTKGRAAYVIPHFWQKRVCDAFALTVDVTGTPVKDRQVIYVSNHISYLDIPVISTILPYSFVAKADVADWPLFGLLARLQQTAFISRSRTDAAKEKSALQNMLKDGKSLIIFPEGTSTDGRTVLPFKASLFSIALDETAPPGLVIQPFTVEIAETDGKPVNNQAGRDLYAWHGDMTLLPHLWRFAKSEGARINLHFHPPLTMGAETHRKALAADSQALVAGGLGQAEILQNAA